MNLKITYSKVKHGRARVLSDGSLKLTIPYSMKNNKSFHEALLEKGKILIEKQKGREKNKILPVTEEGILIFGERINKENIPGNLDLYLKRELLNESICLIEKYTNLIGVTYNKVSVRKLKSKWGSCSSNKNISLNLFLIHLPKKYLEYVVIHEVCHLIEMNHSKNFWSLVQKLSPDYLKIRKEMKQFSIK